MRCISFFIILFSIQCHSYGQLGYSKKIINEKHNGFSQVSSLTSCQDSTLAIFSFFPVKGETFYSNTIIALKHDSLGRLENKQYLKFPEFSRLNSCFYYYNKVFVIISLKPQGGTGDSQRRLVFLRFSNNLILEKSVVFYSIGKETSGATVFNQAPDSSLILSGRSVGLNSGVGDQFLAQLDFDLNILQSIELKNQFRYSLPGFSKNNFYWYTYEGRYTLDRNFNTISIDSLVSSNNSRPSVIGFQSDNKGIKLRVIDFKPSEDDICIVRFNENHQQQKILLTSDFNLRDVNNQKQNREYFRGYLNENDSLRIDFFTTNEDSGYTLKQTVLLNDTVFSNTKPHKQTSNHFFVQHIDSKDTSINFLKGIDTVTTDCLNISFPPDTIVDTNSTIFSFVPHINNPPALSKDLIFLTEAYPILTIDSLNAAGDTSLPAFSFLCENKACGVFDPPSGGLICNQGNQKLLTVDLENPFGIDESLLITRIVWNDVLEQLSFLATGGQTVKVFGENEFCEQTAFITLEFDSVRATETVVGDICLDEPGEATISIDGLFENIDWQNPDFNNVTFQRVNLPGTFPYTVTSLKGCRLNKTAIVPEKCLPKIYIPNAFTPNGDGKNDNFVGYADFTDEFLFRIYDRWGHVIFSTSTSPIVWDGKFKGTLVQLGVYNWRLTYNTVFKGVVYTDDIFGHITAVR